MDLPPEIWDYILSLVEPRELQATARSLLCALPASNLSRAALWRHLHLTREDQAWQATKQLRSNPGYRSSVVTVRAEAWRDDAQLLVNLLLSLDRVKSLRCVVGPLFAPEHLEELLEAPAWKGSIESLWLRYNPYVLERSYYTFLKGAYFDTTPLQLAKWSASDAPHLRQLAFVQDLPPNHGIALKETPAFGLQPVADALEEVLLPPLDQKSTTEGRMLDFAQPIVFFKLFCLATLAISPVGSQLTHLVLRLPRRNLLTALTAYPPSPLPTPYASLKHLDLSTTHIIADPRLPSLLRLHPNLEHVVLDRCTGLIGMREAMEQPVILTLRWLGKCFGGIGASRSEEVMRAWRKIIKERPTGVPAPGPPSDGRPGAPPHADEEKKPRKVGRSGYSNMPRAKPVAAVEATRAKPVLWTSERPPLVKDVVMIPPAPKARSLGFGLFPIDSSVDALWRSTFMEGYDDALTKTAEKIEEVVHRWEAWREAGKLADLSRRMVTFYDAVPPKSPWIDWDYEEKDEVFAAFCKERKLVVISPAAAQEVLTSIRAKTFVFCTVADCPSTAGVPHVSLSNISKEVKSVREAREKSIWEQEERERAEWRRPAEEHLPGCAHLASRDAWPEE